MSNDYKVMKLGKLVFLTTLYQTVSKFKKQCRYIVWQSAWKSPILIFCILVLQLRAVRDGGTDGRATNDLWIRPGCPLVSSSKTKPC